MINGVNTCNLRHYTHKVITDAVPGTVTIDLALLLFAANLVISWVTKESVRACADRLVVLCGTKSVAAANDRSRACIFTLKQPVVPADTVLGDAAVLVGPAPGLLLAQPIVAGVQQWALGGVLAFGSTGSAGADLVLQTFSGRLARWRTDTETAQHPGWTLLLGRAELQLGAA